MADLHYLDLCIWPCSLYFCSNQDDYDEFMDGLEIEQHEMFPGTFADACVKELSKNNERIYIVCIDPGRFRKRSATQKAGLLAHEALHVVDNLQESIGDMGTEGRAYTLQRILMGLLAWEKEVQKEIKNGKTVEIGFDPDDAAEQSS